MSMSWTDYAAIANIILVVVVGIQVAVAHRQAKLMSKQTEVLADQFGEQRRGNLVATTLAFLDADRRAVLKEALDDALAKVTGYEKSQVKLSDDQVSQIRGDAELRRPVVNYLNHHENLCVAISEGALDEEMVRKLVQTRIVRLWDLFEPYANRVRIERNQPAAFKEIERVATKWRGAYEREREGQESQEAAQASRALNDSSKLTAPPLAGLSNVSQTARTSRHDQVR